MGECFEGGGNFCKYREVVVPNLEDELNELRAKMRALRDTNRELEMTNVDLSVALEEFGGHKPDCCCWIGNRSCCDCGFNTILVR